MNDKETWIEETFNSLDGITPVEMPPSLHQQIINRLQTSEAKVIAIRPQVKWAIAASLALLISVNSLIVIGYNRTMKQSKQEAYTFYKNYFDYTEQF